MALNRINADSIADGTVVASDIADGTITTQKLAAGTLDTANSASIYANGAFTAANTKASTGKSIAMAVVFGG